uniref:NADH-ubiquinone oxidoreductase chain 2 n=1 Tax=Craugastor saltator TaxID=228439 RepID=Q53ED3_9NEOB|nr:NADH dehydrogenase subunit II [Craugastor saltator]
MNPISITIIILSLTGGTIIAISGHHWIAAWLGLELNTLAIIPLMIKPPHPRAAEATTKYFLVQTTGSAMMMFSSILNAWMNGDWIVLIGLNPLSTFFLTMALAIKLGMAPFHFWMPDVIQGLTLPTSLVLATWMKLPPVAILTQLSPSLNLELMLSMAVLSTLSGGWGGINQTQLRKILAYSSIAHLGWVAAAVKLCPKLALLNFFVYTVLTSALFLTFIILKTTNMSQLTKAWSNSPMLILATLLTLLSLAGLPPLAGFLPKWLVIQELVKQDLPALAMMLLLSTLLSLFFYLRLAYIMLLMIAPNSVFSAPKWKPSTKFYVAIPITLSVIMAISYPLIKTFLLET